MNTSVDNGRPSRRGITASLLAASSLSARRQREMRRHNSEKTLPSHEVVFENSPSPTTADVIHRVFPEISVARVLCQSSEMFQNAKQEVRLRDRRLSVSLSGEWLKGGLMFDSVRDTGHSGQSRQQPRTSRYRESHSSEIFPHDHHIIEKSDIAQIISDCEGRLSGEWSQFSEEEFLRRAQEDVIREDQMMQVEELQQLPHEVFHNDSMADTEKDHTEKDHTEKDDLQYAHSDLVDEDDIQSVQEPTSLDHIDDSNVSINDTNEVNVPSAASTLIQEPVVLFLPELPSLVLDHTEAEEVAINYTLSEDDYDSDVYTIESEMDESAEIERALEDAISFEPESMLPSEAVTDTEQMTLEPEQNERTALPSQFVIFTPATPPSPASHATPDHPVISLQGLDFDNDEEITHQSVTECEEKKIPGTPKQETAIESPKIEKYTPARTPRSVQFHFDSEDIENTPPHTALKGKPPTPNTVKHFESLTPTVMEVTPAKSLQKRLIGTPASPFFSTTPKEVNEFESWLPCCFSRYELKNNQLSRR